jgi:hypothetical protein
MADEMGGSLHNRGEIRRVIHPDQPIQADKNREIDGFIMSIVEGFLEVNGKKYSLYGFVELII